MLTLFSCVVLLFVGLPNVHAFAPEAQPGEDCSSDFACPNAENPTTHDLIYFKTGWEADSLRCCKDQCASSFRGCQNKNTNPD